MSASDRALTYGSSYSTLSSSPKMLNCMDSFSYSPLPWYASVLAAGFSERMRLSTSDARTVSFFFRSRMAGMNSSANQASPEGRTSISYMGFPAFRLLPRSKYPTVALPAWKAEKIAFSSICPTNSFVENQSSW